MTNFALAILLLCSCGTVRAKQEAKSTAAATVPQWSVHELTLAAARGYDNPYKEADVSATFTGPGGLKQTVRGFWDGGNAFKIRFTPTKRGTWSYVTTSNDPGLNAKSGSFACTAPAKNARGFLRRDRAHPYHFVFDDGARYFMFGTTHYGLMQNAMAGERWKEAIDKGRSFGINKVRMVAAPPFGSRHDRVKYPAASGFVADDRDRPDPAHWRRLDEVVRFMAERGVIADLILYWNSDRSYGTPAQDERFTRYCIARYAAYPNVIWCLTNEWNYTPKPIEYWNRMGVLAKSEDPYAAGENPRLLSIHQQTRHDFQFFDQKWLSHAIVQLGVRNQGKTFRGGNEWDANNAAEEGRTFRHGDEWGNFSITNNWGHNLPVVNDEYGYIGEPQDQSVPKDAAGKYRRLTRDKHRHIMWGIAAAAGYAAAGDKHSYPDGAPYFSANWHDAPEYADIKHLTDFFTGKGIEYWKLAPANSIVKEGKRVYASSEPGRQYVAYAAQGGRFALGLPDGDYVARRFDPRTGADVPLGAVKGGTQTFTMPDAQDWVVYLMDKSGPARARRGRRTK